MALVRPGVTVVDMANLPVSSIGYGEISSQTSKTVKFVLLFATSYDGIIGIGSKLPWDCPEDLAHFKKVTQQPDSAMFMGRKTWESLPIGKYSGEKLAGRTKIVLSRTARKPMKDTIFLTGYTMAQLTGLGEALGLKTIFFIGGAEVIKEAYYYCDEAIITWIGNQKGNWLSDPGPVARWNPDILRNVYYPAHLQEVLSPQATVKYYKSLPGNDF